MNCRKNQTNILSDPEILESRADVLFFEVCSERSKEKDNPPFSNEAGKLIRKIAGEILPKKILVFSKIVLCTTLSHAAQMQKLRDTFDPKIFVPCGNSAMRVSGISDDSITKNAGTVFEKDGMTILPVVHPNSIVRAYVGKNVLYEQMTNIFFELRKKKEQK